MVHYSVLITQRDALGAVGRQLPLLCQMLQDLILPYEIICIDDASEAPSAARLARFLREFPPLRVLRFDSPRGTSAALSAGIAASRGDLVIALDANTRVAAGTLGQLISRLSQHDLVFADSERSRAAELCEPLSRFPRLLAAHPELHAREGFFWAARREAVSSLALAPGAFRVLPGLLAARGFRVCRLTLAAGLAPQGSRYAPGTLERLAIRWLSRRFEPHLAGELRRGEANLPQRSIAREAVRPHHVPLPAVVPVDKDRRESA
jgi:hypothetical protein